MQPADHRSSSSGSPSFPSTRWTLVEAMRSDAETVRKSALEQLCRIYWYPIYCFARRSGAQPADAEDATQEFFLRALERETFATAKRERGTLRSWLILILRSVLADRARRRDTVKRGRGVEFISFDAIAAEDRYTQEPADLDTPERIFERTSACAVAEAVLECVRSEHAAQGKAALVEALHPFVIHQPTESVKAALVRRLGMNDGAFRTALSRYRGKFKDRLRRQVEALVLDPGEVESEMAAICAALAH